MFRYFLHPSLLLQISFSRWLFLFPLLLVAQRVICMKTLDAFQLFSFAFIASEEPKNVSANASHAPPDRPLASYAARNAHRHVRRSVSYFTIFPPGRDCKPLFSFILRPGRIAFFGKIFFRRATIGYGPFRNTSGCRICLSWGAAGDHRSSLTALYAYSAYLPR